MNLQRRQTKTSPAGKKSQDVVRTAARSNLRRALVVAALAGALNSLCWLPFGLAPLIPVALLLAMRGLRMLERTRDAALFGAVFAAVRVAVGGHYILSLVTYSRLAPVLLAMDIAYYLPFDILLMCGALALERKARVPRTVAFALLYVALEWARTLGDLSNCSDTLAHGFGVQPSWLAWNSWAGPYFISVLALGVALALDAAIRMWPRRGLAITTAAAAAVLWVAPPVSDLVAGPAPSHAAPGLRVGIVQPSISVEEKLDRQRWPQTWAYLEELSRRAADGADLVIWPETARPGAILWRDGQPFSDPEMEQLAKRIGVPILYGCEIARIRGGKVAELYNAAALARADGERGEWYAKQRLLPFVEGVPFASWFGWDPAKARREPGPERSFLTLLGHFSRGTTPTIFHVGPARIGVLICYEGFYPQLVRRYRLAGANALCVMTNDAWWGHTIFAKWHAQMVASRAREADVPVVRAANSGVSSITDRSGKIGATTGLFEKTVLQVDLHPSDAGPTIYGRTGDLLVWADLAALAILWIAAFLRPRRDAAAQTRVVPKARPRPAV